MEDWRAALAHRAQRRHGGVDIGALLAGPQHADALRRLLNRLTRTRLCIAIYRLPASPTHGLESGLVLHLEPPAAMLFEASAAPLPPELARLVATAPAVYLSGVRCFERALGRAPPTLPLAPPPPPADARFTFAELFAGIGGFRLGLEALGGVCTFASELDPFAAATYRLNWPEASSAAALVLGDISWVQANDVPPFDIITGGFPCQTFSVRGDQAGCAIRSNDWRGALYLEMIRLLQQRRPKGFLFENVVGLVLLDVSTIYMYACMRIYRYRYRYRYR